MSLVTAISIDILTFEPGNFLYRFFDKVGRVIYNATSAISTSQGRWGGGREGEGEMAQVLK